jgi:hypothetical protein
MQDISKRYMGILLHLICIDNIAIEAYLFMNLL